MDGTHGPFSKLVRVNKARDTRKTWWRADVHENYERRRKFVEVQNMKWTQYAGDTVSLVRKAGQTSMYTDK